MATQDQLRRSIEPGSLPYGQRQALEQGLGQMAAPQGAGGPDPGADLGIPGNPLDPMLQGALPTSDDPMAGLGPQSQDPKVDSRVERLRAVAMSAKSPVVRELAIRSIRGLLRELEANE